MRVAYLVNRYPRTSHSFIRREILAVESQGVEVLRFSQRALDEPLADEADRAELARTHVVLAAGIAAHAWAVLVTALWRPIAFARAAWLALRIGRRSDRGLARHVIYLAESCVLLRWLERGRVEHLHAHFGTNPAALAMLCRVLGGPPYSFTVHGPDEFDKPEFLALREKIRHAAFAVAISSFGRSQLCRWARHEDWPRIEVVRCGVGEELLRAPRVPVPSEPRLVCVARLSSQKGHLLLVEAAARLAAEQVRFEILLVGDGPMRGEIEALVRRHGLERHVRIAGWMDSAHVREALLSARALVLPSFAEGLPVVVMEALALGRPVITTAIAGTPELVQPGVTGWLVPAGSVEALVPAMREALETPTARLEEMGRAGTALVARRHDVEQEARKLAALFRGARTGAEPPSREPDADGSAPGSRAARSH